ncbi:hypothetical protein Stsp02_08080 [Streptomyces sp. NBRC 14336]|uniref:hypothetical protein n=1 Tax=Streptomyces sp. NBRC 14336 TaxID=3030992 RepID=UPI0024A1FFE3|nr:hypothetical protein [Streptomyces sp. NBRC 14336]GLW45146.1 hypothetical protein Stsp02_08080 [Streptomyces sp. NBRC 14336]
MDRLKAQASKNREAAKLLRSRGKDTAAKQMEARADELESGRVTDVTDSVVGLFRWAQGR